LWEPRLANIPAKWSNPELSSGFVPAHAQTSNCPAGTSTLTVFLLGDVTDTETVGVITSENGDFASGYTAFFDCQSGCLYFFVDAGDAGAHVIFTVNGVVVFDDSFSNETHYVTVDGATGENDIDVYVPACDD